VKLLTATTQTQGQRPDDFAWCIPGEIVTPFVTVCDRQDPDNGCGCGRSFAGLNSARGTTTAIVADIDGYTLEDLTEAVHAYRRHAGWTDGADRQVSEQHAADIAETAAEFGTGDVLEVRLGEVTRR
jgi:hypothetical protein